MDSEGVVKLLTEVRRGKVSVSQALARLRHLPFEDLGFAKVDHHRALRQGFPEVIMGQGKEPKEIAAIVRALRRRKGKRTCDPVVSRENGAGQTAGLRAQISCRGACRDLGRQAYKD